MSGAGSSRGTLLRLFLSVVLSMTGGCIGLTNIIDDLRLVTKTSLGCLSQGDRVSFREPTLGRMTCFVTSVEPQKPEPKS